MHYLPNKAIFSSSYIDPYQTLLAQQAEQQSIAHFPQVLETHRLQLSVLNDVLQLVVKELEDPWKEIQTFCNICHIVFNIHPNVMQIYLREVM